MPRTNLSTSLGGTVETDIPDDVEVKEVGGRGTVCRSLLSVSCPPLI